ncbi:DUF368 domain-containing protein [Stutzerimonas tarimensis]|uniref:DUF368 domain-containing protein n=1 Tax=Stutzerimonas tarimensis TaxID=1507735 RepID=A0ABV7T1J0_9GAMM
MKDTILLYAKGLAMGAADVVPGVSGGTIAFITGIYDRLLAAIAAVPQAVMHLARGRIGQAWKAADATFLITLLAGVLTSIFSLARIITYLLEEHPIPVWSFFFGLILVSVYLVGREVEQRRLSRLVCFAAGLLFAYWITVMAPMQMGSGPLSIFMAGAIAICAMILPGISGSFILVLLGLYPVVLGAVRSLDFGLLGFFAAGALLGLVSFARLLSWMLKHYRDGTLAFLTGLMVGSLNKVWPWKETLTWRTNSAGEEVPVLQQNLLPGAYGELTGQDPQMFIALLLAVSGVALVLGLEWVAGRVRQPVAS